LDPYTYDYMNPAFQRNEEAPVLHNNTLSTDIIREKSIGFLEDAAQNPDTPFWLTIAPIAPHSDFVIDMSGDPPVGITISPPVSADRHKDLFANATVPRGPSFNPDVPSGVDWIYDTPVLSAENITYNDHLYRQRLRALQAVDEIVEEVVAKLDEHDLLDNTYIFYTADNGYHIGQHRLPPGKGCGFEEDINVPLIVRGPGVPANKTVSFATNHIDLAPTWWDIFDIPLREDFDGIPFPLTEEGITSLEQSGTANEHVQIEFWMQTNPGEYNNEDPVNNTYKGVRIVGEGYGWYYSVWCSGSHELYDMTVSALFHPPLQFTLITMIRPTHTK
jgi:arylsulfatase A-like enzyme